MSTRRSTARPTGIASTVQGPKLPRIRRRLHDTIDLASGRIFSTRIARPLTAAERVERLARFGFKANPSIFAKPTHRLTPRAPYQSAPEANTFVSSGPKFQVFSYSTSDPPTGQIWWRMPATFETEFMSGINFFFINVPPGPIVWSLVFQAYPYQGRTGVVVIEMIGHPRREIAISMIEERTVDIGLVHNSANLDTRVFWRPGFIDFVFYSVSVGRGLIVLDPTTRSRRTRT
jgi:hypothetical protein